MSYVTDSARFICAACQVSERDLHMTFLPQFEACVKAGTYSVMCSYSRYSLLLTALPVTGHVWLIVTCTVLMMLYFYGKR